MSVTVCEEEGTLLLEGLSQGETADSMIPRFCDLESGVFLLAISLSGIIYFSLGF